MVDKKLFILVFLLISINGIFAQLENSVEVSIKYDRDATDFVFSPMGENATITFNEICLNKKCTQKTIVYEIKNGGDFLKIETKQLKVHLQNYLEIKTLNYNGEIIKLGKNHFLVRNPMINREFSQLIKLGRDSVSFNYNHFKNYTTVKKSGPSYGRTNIERIDSVVFANLKTNNGNIEIDTIQLN